MTSPLLVFCLGPSRVPFLHPADWVLSSQPAQSAVPVPLSVPLWVPAAFPTGPSGADLLVHPTVAVPPVPWGKSRLSHGPSPSSTRPVLSWGPFALLGYFSVPSSSCFPHLSPGPLAHPQSLSEFTPLPAVPIPILVFSFSATPLGVPSYSPFRSFPVPWRTGRTASNSAPGMLTAAAPGLGLSLWRPRSHLSAVTRGPSAAASSHLCPESLSCWVFACWVPTRSLRPRVPVAPHSPRRTLGCGRCCCPRCGSARGNQSHPTVRSAPRPHSTPPSTPPTDMF